jgi:cytochrome c biogenesis protein CcdA/thiol-disulfide isomerase/thioredoxin
MTLLILAFLAGGLTILSPCILPVLPFVFAGAGRRFTRTGLPLLLGMASAFTGVATLAAVGGGWALAANQYGRFAALALFALFASTLLSDRLAEWLYRPFVAVGRRLSSAGSTGDERTGPLASALLGVATGLLWAPCAGPILGLVLTGAALNGASVGTTLLIFAYALGTVTSLALALGAGARVSAALKRAVGPGEWLRRGLGVAVLGGVVAIGFGWDGLLLSRIEFANTTSFEERLLEWTGARKAAASERTAPAAVVSPASGAGDRRSAVSTEQGGAPLLIDVAFSETPSEARTPQAEAKLAASTGADLPVEGALPGFAGATEWLNSPPLTAQALRGKVVLVVFWTFECYNCLNALPHVRAWAEKYRDHGFIVVGVHTPELPFERDVGNVRNAVARLKIDYPVAIDNSYAIWKAFGNEYWPAAYFVDAQGRIRHHHFGEHDYENSERVIQQLLREAGHRDVPGGFVTASGAP